MEAKNCYIKRAASIGNFKNIALSVAKRHQRLMCAYSNERDFFGKELKSGPGMCNMMMYVVSFCSSLHYEYITICIHMVHSLS